MAEKKYGAESISILEGLEAVRKSRECISKCWHLRFNHLIYEIVDNAR